MRGEGTDTEAKDLARDEVEVGAGNVAEGNSKDEAAGKAEGLAASKATRVAEGEAAGKAAHVAEGEAAGKAKDVAKGVAGGVVEGEAEEADGVVEDEVDRLAEQWARSGMPAAAIARLELSKRVSRLALRHEQAMKAALAGLNLTYAEFDVLAALRRAGGPLRPSELTRSLFLTSGGTSNVLQRLTAAGYVDREPNAADGRGRLVHLTPTGESVTDKAMAISARVHEHLLAGIPDTTIRAAANALREITKITDY
ncbi:MarR family winged helix-turn-helix transcriptional regulator [Actinophytocola sp.]|uniref:MarR family winged helix-turn-helix transcriptional regulator n=1 Tax=Actinophytocola sp. TaxID=1872138 RepID=UPI003899E56F